MHILEQETDLGFLKILTMTLNCWYGSEFSPFEMPPTTAAKLKTKRKPKPRNQSLRSYQTIDIFEKFNLYLTSTTSTVHTEVRDRRAILNHPLLFVARLCF